MKNKIVYFGIGVLIIGVVALVFMSKSSTPELAHPIKETVVERSKVDSAKVITIPKKEVIKKTTEKEVKTEEKTASQIQSDIMKDVLKHSK
jgi:hypothetical protein